MWGHRSRTVTRALAMIADGALDGEGGSIETLAERLGLGGRQVRRLFQRHVGAAPSVVARTRRVLLAKQLLQETTLPMTEVALASGFASLRQFNETFHTLFHRPPSALRRAARGGAGTSPAGVTVRLSYRPPYDWNAVLHHLRARAVAGVELVSEATYARTVLQRGRVGTIEVAHDESRACLAVSLRLPDLTLLSSTISRLRRMFDLDSDVATIAAHLARDPVLAPLVLARPGLRVIGGWDGFEVAVRAVLGQQVTVAAGRALVGQLVERCAPLERGEDVQSRAFPGPAEVAAADLAGMKMPTSRKHALQALARAALADPSLFRTRASLSEALDALQAIRGLGDWTASYIALRAMHEPDAFPAQDAVLHRAITALEQPMTTAGLRARAEGWRPWRGYAAQHLWTADLVQAAARDPRPGQSR